MCTCMWLQDVMSSSPVGQTPCSAQPASAPAVCTDLQVSLRCVDHAFQFQPEVEEAERDATEALKKAKNKTVDVDVLAILLQGLEGRVLEARRCHVC